MSGTAKGIVMKIVDGKAHVFTNDCRISFTPARRNSRSAWKSKQGYKEPIGKTDRSVAASAKTQVASMEQTGSQRQLRPQSIAGGGRHSG